MAPYHTRCITQEQLLADPVSIFNKLCRDWGFAFDPEYLNWKNSFKENPNISYTEYQKNYMEKHGTFQDFTGQQAYGVTQEQNHAKHVLSDEEISLIETELAPIYNQILKMTAAYYPAEKVKEGDSSVLRIA